MEETESDRIKIIRGSHICIYQKTIIKDLFLVMKVK